MRALPVSLLKRRSIYLVFTAILACDTKEDSLEPETEITSPQIEFYTLPASSIIIDLKSVIKKPFISTSLMISKNPVRGSLTKLDTSILKYTPNAGFTHGKDQFIFSAVLRDGTTIKGEAIPIYMKTSEAEFPCGVYPVEDDVGLTSKSAAVVHVSKNDHICDVNGPMNVFIRLAPKFGEALVVGDSIIYTPGPSFPLGDELVYGLSTSGGDEVTLGLVSFSNTQLEVLNVPSGSNQIFFVDDTIGFIAGRNFIHKTIDGGKRWIPLEYATEETNNFSIEEIHFLDKDRGFAAISRCPGWTSYCSGGWLMTSDGGLSWKRFDRHEMVKSIFFTSSLTGFISTSIDNDPDLITDHTIYKTIDGGETWDEIFRRHDNAMGLRIRFANDLVGYVHDPTAIYKTTDGGQSWEPSANEIVSSFAIIANEVACASFSSNSNFATTHTPSAIVRSENGSAWKPVASFSYTILSQGFSPAGDLGLAGGLSAYDPEAYLLTISKSTDKGKTWVDLIKNLDGYPLQISVPSANVAYILCSGKIIKYSP